MLLDINLSAFEVTNYTCITKGGGLQNLHLAGSHSPVAFSNLDMDLPFPATSSKHAQRPQPSPLFHDGGGG